MYGIRDSGMESNFVCNQAETGNYIHCYAMITYAYRRLHAKLFGLDKQPKLTVQLRLFLVEVVGLEPTSYSAAKILSTYLFYLLFLKTQRG